MNNQTPFGFFPGGNMPGGGGQNPNACNCQREIRNINMQLRNLERRVTRLERMFMRSDDGNSQQYYDPNFVSTNNKKYEENNYMI